MHDVQTFACLPDFQDVATTQPDPDSDLDMEAERLSHLQQCHTCQFMTVMKTLTLLFNVYLGWFRACVALILSSSPAVLVLSHFVLMAPSPRS